MGKKHYSIDTRVSKVWDELLKRKEDLRKERNEVIQGLFKQILFEEVLDKEDDDSLFDAGLKMEDINMKAAELKRVMGYIEAGDYSKIETLFNDAMEEYDEQFVFEDEF